MKNKRKKEEGRKGSKSANMPIIAKNKGNKNGVAVTNDKADEKKIDGGKCKERVERSSQMFSRHFCRGRVLLLFLRERCGAVRQVS